MNVFLTSVLILVIICLTVITVAGFRRYYNYIGFYILIRNRYRYRVEVCDMWLSAYQKNRDIGSFLRERDIDSVVIYGLGTLGVRLYNELKKDKSIRISCAVKNPFETDRQYTLPDLPVIDSVDALEDKNAAVIVTEFFEYAKVKDELNDKGFNTIYSLDEILQTMLDP